MAVQPPTIIITFTFIGQNSSEDNGAITISTKEKKSWKAKTSGTLSTKKADTKAKRPAVNDLVDDLADIVSLTFFQGTKDQANYGNCALAYYYCLFLIFHSFN